MVYDTAIHRVAGEIARIQEQYGRDAFAVLSGASLTTEKSYLMGKFAHMCLRTANIDYNGRLCMVSAAAASKKAFGIDRGGNPFSDIIGTDVVWISGANIGECHPITSDYVWQAREHGAKIIVVDPRVTPIARTCDLFMPIKPGRDVLLFKGILHLMIANDWLDHDFIEQHTTGFEQVAEDAREWTPARTAEATGIAEKAIRQAAEWWGTAKTSFLMHARGIEHHTHGVQNVLGAINLVLASGRIGRPNCGYSTITGQGNGQGGREHGQKCDQLPGGRDLANPEHRAYIAGVWGMEPEELPQPGADAYEIFREIDRGNIKGLLSICFNPLVSLPDNSYVREQLEKLEFYVAIDFFLSETGRYADVILPGSLHEEDEGTVTQAEGRVIKWNKAIDCPGDARQDWIIIQDIAEALGRPEGFRFQSPREIFDELRVASAGGIADYSGITYEKIEAQYGVFWPCYSETIRTPRPSSRLLEPGCPGQGAVLLPGRAGALQRARLHPAGRRTGRGIPALPDDRPGGQPVSFRRPDPAHRPARGPVSGAAHRASPQPGREAGHRRWGLGDRGKPAWVRDAARERRAHDPARHDLHSLPLARQKQCEPADDLGPGPDFQDSRIQGLRRTACQGGH